LTVLTAGLTRYLLIAALLLLAGAGAYALGFWLRPAPELSGTAFDQPVLVSGLELVDHSGATVDLAGDFNGQLTLVFFGFTRCPDVCPFTMARLGRIYQDLGAPADLNVVMLTVDPEHDTPAVLGAYVKSFHPEFIGLTGTTSQVATAARAFFIGYAGSGGAVVHSDAVAVLDRQGRLRYVYGQDAVPNLAADLPRLLRMP